MKRRRIAKLHAWLGGYFWLPCPNCGQMFGGHESARIDGHMSAIPHNEHGHGGHMICPDCTALGVGCRAYAAIGQFRLDDPCKVLAEHGWKLPDDAVVYVPPHVPAKTRWL